MGTLILLLIPIIIAFHERIQFAIDSNKFKVKSIDISVIRRNFTNIKPAIPAHDDPRNNKSFRVKLYFEQKYPKKFDFNVSYPTITKYNPKLFAKTVTAHNKLNNKTSYIFVAVYDKTSTINFSLNLGDIKTNYHIGIQDYLNLDDKNKNMLIGFSIITEKQGDKIDLFAATLVNKEIYQFSPS